MERGMRQSWSSFFGGTGFYIALVLCVLATGVAGYFLLFTGQEAEDVGANVDNVVTTPNPVEQTPTITPSSQEEAEVPEEDDTEVTSKPVTVIVPEVQPDPDAEPVEAEVPNIVVAPLAGETVSVFSMDALQYNETMGDWRTHDGVDIAATAGTAVVSAGAGTVLSVEENGRLGVTVVIAQRDGYEATYGSLGEELSVAEGDTVSAGQQIGVVGNTSLTESGLGAHLHFSVAKDGVAVDPAEYLPQ